MAAEGNHCLLTNQITLFWPRSIVFSTNQNSLFQLFYCLLTNQSMLSSYCFFFCLVANQMPLFCPPGLVFVLQKDGGLVASFAVVERRGVENNPVRFSPLHSSDLTLRTI